MRRGGSVVCGVLVFALGVPACSSGDAPTDVPTAVDVVDAGTLDAGGDPGPDVVATEDTSARALMLGRYCNAAMPCPDGFDCERRVGSAEGTCVIRCADAQCPAGARCQPVVANCVRDCRSDADCGEGTICGASRYCTAPCSAYQRPCSASEICLPGGLCMRCAREGELCSGDGNCCPATPGLTCVSGRCRAPTACLARAAECTSPSQCCSGLTCLCIGVSGCNCCTPPGGACATATDCCGGDPCMGGHCCRPSNAICTTGAECCSGTCGVNGLCR